MDATISVVCYKSKTLSNGEHPLMLRISKDGKKKYQSLGISVNPKFWDFQKNKPKPKCPNLEYLQKIILDKKLELQKKMLEIKSGQKEYSAATLIEANEKLLVAKTVDCFYKEIIAQCEIIVKAISFTLCKTTSSLSVLTTWSPLLSSKFAMTHIMGIAIF